MAVLNAEGFESGLLPRLGVFEGEDFVRVVERALADLGRLLDADRAYVFFLDECGATLGFAVEWTAPGVPGHDLSAVEGLPLATFPWSAERFRRGQLIHVSDPEALPAEAAPERETCRALGIRCYVNLPLFPEDRLMGWLGFDACDDATTWGEEELGRMEAAADLLTMTLARYAQYQRARRQRAIEVRLTTLGMLVSSVDHELRSPLTATLTNLDLALATPGLDHELKEILTDAHEGVRHAVAITQDLRALRPCGAVHGPTDEALDLAEAIELTLRLTPVERRVAGRIERDVPSALTVRGDRSRLVQILINLLDNAAQAIQEGSPDATIRIEALARGEAVELVVADTGPGIPPAARGRLFTPFATTREAGTGLGLVTSRQLARSMGGDLVLEDNAPSGVRAVLRLPTKSK